MTAQAGGASSSYPASYSARDRAERATIRRRMRQRRRQVTRGAQRLAARRIAQQLMHAMLLRPGRCIGVYLALPGEADLTVTIECARVLGCRLYLPHIVNVARGQMAFYRHDRQHRLRTNRWGIPQLPSVVGRTPARSIDLDVVLVPLVAFDAQGHRLGMGAGFYDRYFARRRRNRQWRRPLLVGIAYSFQQVASIPNEAHDVDLDAVVTEHGLMRFTPR